MSKVSDLVPILLLLGDKTREQGNPQDDISGHMSSLMRLCAGFIKSIVLYQWQRSNFHLPTEIIRLFGEI